MEQQLPRVQFPQTALPKFAPHDPSLVTGPAAEALEEAFGRPRTGSSALDEGVSFDSDAINAMDLLAPLIEKTARPVFGAHAA